MDQWIDIDLKDDPRLRPSQERRDGVPMNVIVSPYDVPEAVRSHWDPKSRRLLIEFRYIGGGEKSERREVEGEVWVLSGESSGRLYGIEVADPSFQASRIAGIIETLPKLLNEPLAARDRKPNYALVGDTLRKLWARLIPTEHAPERATAS